MGPPALLPIREEGVLRIFISLNNQSPWPGSNPQNLGQLASTLTTTPPRRLFTHLHLDLLNHHLPAGSMTINICICIFHHHTSLFLSWFILTTHKLRSSTRNDLRSFTKAIYLKILVMNFPEGTNEST
jgi:hypothetical protein